MGKSCQGYEQFDNATNMDLQIVRNGKVKFECYDREIFEKYAKRILSEVNRNFEDFAEALGYVKQRWLRDPKSYEILLLPVSVPSYKGIFEVRVDYKDGKNELTLCQLTENCDYRFQGRLLLSGYDCWDLKAQTKLVYNQLGIDPKKAKEAQEKAAKRTPTMEEILPEQFSRKINTRSFKALIEEKFPPTSPAYRVIMPERDELMWIEFWSKIDTWMRVIRISSGISTVS
jgi:hypothetical protein